MENSKPHILEITRAQFAGWLSDHEEADYRGPQVMEWVYNRRAASFEEMTNLPVKLREALADSFAIAPPKEIKQQTTLDGETGKLLLELSDGETVECVWMNDRGRHTFCVSSQVGCPLGCKFCATGSGGFTRNLTTLEILGQVIALARLTGELRNVVFMGMGEPLLNLDAVLPALDALTDTERFGLSPRHISVSTAGITDGIIRLAGHPVAPNLALSLNSPFDNQRAELMPIANKYPLDEIIVACNEYSRRTTRKIFIEYVLIAGKNTDTRSAKYTASIAKRIGATVNLIPFNAVAGCGLAPPTRGEIAEFKAVIAASGVMVTQRFRRGREISAACGQLRGGKNA